MLMIVCDRDFLLRGLSSLRFQRCELICDFVEFDCLIHFIEGFVVRMFHISCGRFDAEGERIFCNWVKLYGRGRARSPGPPPGPACLLSSARPEGDKETARFISKQINIYI